MMNQRLNRTIYNLLTPEEKEHFSLDGLKRGMYDYWQSGEWSTPYENFFVEEMVYRLKLIPGEVYYFEWDDSQTYGKEIGSIIPDVAKLQENLMFCCEWGGCIATTEEIVVLRPATQEERDEYSLKHDPKTFDEFIDKSLAEVSKRDILNEVYLFKEIDFTPLADFLRTTPECVAAGNADGLAKFIINNYKAIRERVVTEIPADDRIPFSFINGGRELEVYGSRSNYYGKWIDKTLTLYLDRETHEVIGVNVPLTKDMTDKIKEDVKINDHREED